MSRLLGPVGKTAWLERYDWFQNLWRHNLVKIQWKYTYYPISHEVKATTQWNLIKWKKIARETSSFKNHAENKVGKVVPDLLLFFKKTI